MGDHGGGHWLVRMVWRPAGWSLFLPLLISPCTIKSRSSLLAPAHPGGPGKMVIKRLWCGGYLFTGVNRETVTDANTSNCTFHSSSDDNVSTSVHSIWVPHRDSIHPADIQPVTAKMSHTAMRSSSGPGGNIAQLLSWTRSPWPTTPGDAPCLHQHTHTPTRYSYA